MYRLSAESCHAKCRVLCGYNPAIRISDSAARHEDLTAASIKIY